MNVQKLAALWVFCFLSFCRAEDAPLATALPAHLTLGDPAPKLFVSKWLNGDPVPAFEKGTVYIVDFWASWCGPCRAAMPHMSELNTKYAGKNVVVIGMNVKESTQDIIEPFMKQMGDKINFRIALDDMDAGVGKTNQAWLDAVGLPGIPWTFIVDKDGKLAWVGHPMAVETIIPQVLAGTWDAKKFLERKTKLAQAEKKFELAAQSNDGDTMLKLLDEMIALDETETPRAEATRFKVLLIIKHDYDAAYKVGDKVVNGPLKDNAMALSDFAWTIMDAQGVEKRDLDRALAWVSKAAELTKNEDPDVLSVLGRVYYEKGDFAKSLEIVTLALGQAKDEKSKAEFKNQIEMIKQKKG